jgi:hypothetical protein
LNNVPPFARRLLNTKQNKDFYDMKTKIFSFFLLSVMAVTAGAADEQLISVSLTGNQSIARWRNQGVPTRLFLSGQALAVVDLKTVNSLKDLGFQIDVIGPWDHQGSYWVARNGFSQGKHLPGQVVWQKGKTAVIHNASGKDKVQPDPHRYQPFPARSLPDRYWDQVSLGRVAPARLGIDAEIQALVGQVNSDTLTATIQRMQDFRTRLALSDSCNAAEDWLKQKLDAYGYSAEYDSFYHARSLYFAEAWPGAGYDRNVLAKATGAYRPGQEFVVCGHLDATTLGGYYPPADTSICRTNAPGADDNASGSAATLEIARICRGTSFTPSVTYSLWAAEESYLLGSTHYAASSLNSGSDIRGVLNMDMVGWMDDSAIDIDIGSSDPFSQWFNDMYKEAALLYAPELTVFQGMGNASDDMAFADRGYPAVLLIADINAGFNPYYHTTDETIDKLSPLLYTAVTKASLAVTAIVGLYPGPVDSVKCRDIGDGSRLAMIWQPSPEANITGYRLYRGSERGNYTDTTWIAGRTAFAETVAGLWSDSVYYFAITAFDANSRESYCATEATGTPRSAPLAPANLTATPVDSGIALSWARNLELDLAGYNVYHKIDNGAFDSLTFTADSFLLNKPLSGASRYYYKVQASDNDGNKGLLSDSAYSRPITLDQGVLVMDETQNWTAGSFPRDAQQDSFYNYLMAGYKYEQYDFGSVAQKPGLADLGPYSTVLWHSDDPSGFLAYNDTSALREYLGKGGKLWFVGWKPTGDIRNSATYPASFVAGDLLYDCFNISTAGLSGTTDSFKTAIGLKGYPDIAVDTLKYPATIWGKVLRNIEALEPAGTADTIYAMDMKNNGSAYEGKACAVRDSGKVVFFGFPLYYMNKDQARLAAQKVMAEFGEEPLGITGKPENREQIKDIRLFQNVPNPFAQLTNINYQLAKPGLVSLNIYNIAGQLVKTLVNGEQQAGSYTIKWDRHDNQDRQVSAGVYIYHLNIGGKTQSRKMIVLK